MLSAPQEITSSIVKEWGRGGMSKIATDLLNHLNVIRDHRKSDDPPAYRWLWELAQNAADCTKHDSLIIEFEYVKPKREFIFRHNGSPFTGKEVVALIQAWSTKMGEEGLEGKFAKGFLQTHVVSKEITVEGNLEKSYSFCFDFYRIGRNLSDILKQLEGAYDRFKSSIKTERKKWHAEFKYKNLDEKAFSIIDSSLAEFKCLIPLVVALSPKLSEIRVISEAGLECWKKGEEEIKGGETGAFKLQHVKYWRKREEEINREDETNISELRHVIPDSLNFTVAVMTVKETRIVVLGIQNTDNTDRYSLMSPREMPKLFRRYPLWGTRRIGIPVIIDHHFNVYEDRSGPTFGSSPESQDNKDALELALKHVPEFLKWLHDSGWKNLEWAAWVGTPQAEGICNQDSFDFLNESLKNLVIQLSDLPLVPIEESDSIMPASESAIPFVENESRPLEKDYEWKSLWELVRDINPQKAVRCDSAPLWINVLREWVKISRERYHKFGGMTVLDVVEEVKNAGSLKALPSRLKSYVFRWGKVPGSDDRNLRDFLKKQFGVGWVENVGPEKIDDNRATRLSSENESIEIRLSENKYKATVRTSDGRMCELEVEEDGGELKICIKSDENRALDFLKCLYKEIIRGGGSLKELGILPSEFGNFVQEVYTDPGVDPELLAITGEFELSPLNRLLHAKVAAFKEFNWNEILRPLDLEGLEELILQKIRSEANKKSILAPSARFLRWLIRKENRTGMINDFPFVFVSETEETKGKIERPYFSPQSRGHPDVRKYIFLFDIATLADEYNRIFAFCWDKIPENDDKNLREFLKKQFGADWVENAEIEKTDNDGAIRLSLENEFIEIRLSENKDKATVRTSDGETCELEVEEENGELKIYNKILEDSDWEVLENLNIVTPTFIKEKTSNLSSQDERKIFFPERLSDDARNCDLEKTTLPVNEFLNLSHICRVKVRDTPENSLRFITFLLKHLIDKDKSWKEPPEKIYCKTHSQYHEFTHCHWLALLKNHYHWVWESSSPKRAGRPSVQNLKNLLRHGQSKPGLKDLMQELIEVLKSQDSREFLNILGLPPHELALAIGTQSIDKERWLGGRMFEIFQPLRDQPDAIDDLAKLAQEKPNDLVSSLKNLAERAQRIRDNQSLGQSAQKAIIGLIEKREKEGVRLIVDGIHVPADAVIKGLKTTEEGATIRFVEDILLEIKSTHTDEVRDITRNQARTAINNLETYFLCVFPLSPGEKPENVGEADALKRIKVVSNVASYLEPRYREVQGVKDATSGETTWVENLDNLKYAISKEVWESAPNLEQWVDWLLTSPH